MPGDLSIPGNKFVELASVMNTDHADTFFLAKYLIDRPQLGFTTERSEDPNQALIKQDTPDTFELGRNYPNPFNPQTTIGFGIPEAAFVSLRVYDMSGRVVQELVNGNMPAGQHEVQFEAGSLPSGTYMYRLATPEGVRTRVMTLLK